MGEAEKMLKNWQSIGKKTTDPSIERIVKKNQTAQKKKRDKVDAEEQKIRWAQIPILERFKPAKRLRREEAEQKAKEKKEIQMQKRATRRANQKRKKKIEKTCYRRILQKAA